MQTGQRGIEKAARLIGRSDLTIEQQLRDDGRHLKGASELPDGIGVMRQQVPGFHDGGQAFDPRRRPGWDCRPLYRRAALLCSPNRS